jgi:hypothetical protein
MTTPTALQPMSLPRPTPTRGRLSRAAGSRLAIGGLGVVGTALVVIGVRLPWITTFQGLIGQAGWGTRNGSILVALATVSAAAAALNLWRPRAVARWALALAGFATTGFAGYLIVQLTAALSQFDGMTFAAKGPGLFVAAGGGALLLSTIFLPTAAPAQDVVRDEVRSEPRHRWHSARHSRWRWPAAALAVTAGLVHVPVTPAHLAEAPYLGWLFLSLTATLLLAATALLIADSRIVYAFIGVACAAAVVAFVVSRTLGLPLAAEDIGEWSDPLALVAVTAETLAVVAAVLGARGASSDGTAR